jgi:hypothetical protein
MTKDEFVKSNLESYRDGMMLMNKLISTISEDSLKLINEKIAELEKQNDK